MFAQRFPNKKRRIFFSGFNLRQNQSFRNTQQIAPDRVAVGRFQPTAPTDPYVRALTHTVPRIRDSLRFPENRADGTNRGQRITPKDGTEFLPDHRADAVAAVSRPSICKMLPNQNGPSQGKGRNDSRRCRQARKP